MNIYETVTGHIIAALEQGFIPWRKEWKGARGSSLPSNFTTGRAYRGANVIILACSHHSSNQWLTYKQAAEIGAQVRKGSKGMPILFWGRDTRTNKRTGELEQFGFARSYTVFNTEQCDGIPAALPVDAPAFEPIEQAQRIADAYFARPAAPTLRHEGDRAYYSPLVDGIGMPHASSFTSPAAYYQTLYHEMTHSTGTASRLDRDVTGIAAFGGETYSKEELVAEFGAAFLSAEAGTSSEGLLTNSAAYIQNWLKVLRNDSSMAVMAAQKAQRAADYILAREFAADAPAAPAA